MSNAMFNEQTPRTAVDVTPDDDAIVHFSALFVGTAGTVKIVDDAGNTSTWVVQSGQYIVCEIRKVLATGLVDADNLVGLGGPN